jgi:hypothetical protein
MYVDEVLDLAIDSIECGRIGAASQMLRFLSRAMEGSKIELGIGVQSSEFVDVMHQLSLKDFENSPFRLPRKGGVQQPQDECDKDLA